MPHLHLSLQAGDDMILKRMKRRHSRADAIAFCARVRALRPDIVFGADLIAGFPTETDAMFENSLRLVEECGLTWLHVFPFSAARGHAGGAHAAAVRHHPARARGAAAHGRRRCGATLSGGRRRQPGGGAGGNGHSGRCERYAPVRLDRPVEPETLVAADLTHVEGDRLVGRVAA